MISNTLIQNELNAKNNATTHLSSKKMTAKALTFLFIITTGLGFTTQAEARKSNGGKSLSSVVVKPSARHKPKNVVVIKKRQPPRHRHYRRNSLPRLATFAVIAGVSYAIIDNHYYKRQGDQYIYVESPRR